MVDQKTIWTISDLTDEPNFGPVEISPATRSYMLTPIDPAQEALRDQPISHADIQKPSECYYCIRSRSGIKSRKGGCQDTENTCEVRNIGQCCRLNTNLADHVRRIICRQTSVKHFTEPQGRRSGEEI